MTKTNPPHSTQPLEEIVAYLDGELSEVESAQVEQRLSTDETYRRQMQGFDRVWSALDELPGVTASDRFSKTTMEMVVIAAEEEVQQRTQAMPRLRRKRRVAVGVFVMAALFLGFLGYGWSSPDFNRMLIADLPVIEHVDIYSQFQSSQFLRQLRKSLGEEGWIGSARADQQEGFESRQQAELPVAATSSKDRRRWIDRLSSDQQLTLRTKYNRFRDFSPKHQQQLRQLHQQLISAADATQLQETMFQYQQWLERQPPSRQFELREMPEEARVQAIAGQVRQSRNSIVLQLTDQQIEQMVRQIQRRMPDLRDRMQAEMSVKDQRYMASMEGRKRWWALLRWMTQHPSAATDELRLAILEILTESQREQFQQLSRHDQWRNFFFWLHASRFQNSNNSRRGEVGEQDLEDFFAEELDAAQKEELLALPRDAMRKQLERFYWGMERRPDFDGRTGRPPGPSSRRPRNGRPGPGRMHPPRDGFRVRDRSLHDGRPPRNRSQGRDGSRGQDRSLGQE